jgi:hypothetical protein
MVLTELGRGGGRKPTSHCERVFHECEIETEAKKEEAADRPGAAPDLPTQRPAVPRCPIT